MASAVVISERNLFLTTSPQWWSLVILAAAILADSSEAINNVPSSTIRGPPRPTCPEGWFIDSSGNECYHVYTRRPLTRQEALDHCHGLKGELVLTQAREKAVSY